MNYSFRNLVFEGGGVKGIAYVGALHVLEDKDILKNIRRVGGTSAGSIVALLVGLNYSLEEIEAILKDLDFKEFLDDSWGVLRDITRLVTNYGWYKGDSFRNWLNQIIATKTGNPRATFKDIADADASKGFKEMYFISTNLSTRESEVFSNKKTETMSLADAVRISMSIPLFFEAIKQSNNNVYVDGAVIENYPIKLFDRLEYVQHFSTEPEYYMKHNIALAETNPYVFNKETLGFRLDSKTEIALFKDPTNLAHHKIDNLFTYSWSLIEIFIENQQRQHLHSDDWQRTIYIDTLGVKTTQFDIDNEKKAALVKSGIECTNHYFEWFDNPKNDVYSRP
ncbi:MAG: Patatin [Sporomusa sp.]|jgi:NTE family protein|nr:Patatin [Sporomusa sp.]